MQHRMGRGGEGRYYGGMVHYSETSDEGWEWGGAGRDRTGRDLTGRVNLSEKSTIKRCAQ